MRRPASCEGGRSAALVLRVLEGAQGTHSCCIAEGFLLFPVGLLPGDCYWWLLRITAALAAVGAATEGAGAVGAAGALAAGKRREVLRRG